MRKVVTALVVGALLAAGPVLAQAKNGKAAGYEQLNLFSEAYDRIRQDAVEPAGEGKLIGAAIAGMLSGLDSRSAYIDEAAYRAMQTSTNEDQVSLGLVVTIENGQLKVIAPQDGSPAAQAGIMPGDLIYAIDKDPTYDLTLGEAEQKLRGPAGSEVEMTVRRDNRGSIDVTVKRERYRLQTVTARIEAGNILYLRVAGFDSGTPAALTNAVQDLRQRAGNKVIGLILDLRNNPGGAFEASVAVADAFIDKGDIVVVKGRKPDSLRRISATPGDIAQGLPIVALINAGTAREAELVAAGLQDNRRAVLVGTRSFGESSIESLIPLQGNGAIRLTTARFMTPSGQRIQGKGLTPDLTVMPLKLAKLPRGDRLREADLRGALKNTDPAPARDPARDKGSEGKEPAPSLATAEIGSAADEQLSEAADVLRGLALVNGRAGVAGVSLGMVRLAGSRFLVLGAGAVGGYFGGRLAEAEADVTFLVRPARAAALNQRGLVIESPTGDLRLKVQVATADTLDGIFDTVLLTTKAYDLDQAIAAVRPAVGPGTAILPVLNGLRHLDRLDAAFGPERVLGGVAYIAATLTAEGTIRHLNRVHGIAFGERSGAVSRRVETIAGTFAASPVSASISGNIMLDMWEKFVMISSLAGMNCLMRGSVGDILAADEGESLTLELLAECEAIAAASGFPPREEHRQQCRAMLTERGSDFSASMRRDLESGLRTEGDQVLGDMLRRARANGIDAPLLRTAVCHLQVHERRLAARP